MFAHLTGNLVQADLYATKYDPGHNVGAVDEIVARQLNRSVFLVVIINAIMISAGLSMIIINKH